MVAKSAVSQIAVLERFLRVVNAIRTTPIASAKNIQQIALPDMSSRTSQRYLNELTAAGYVSRIGVAGYRYYLTDKASRLINGEVDQMANFKACEHGYDQACLMCGFGTIDGRRMWSDWAMIRQRESVERYKSKLIDLDEALNRCDGDPTIEKYDTIGILKSVLNRLTKFVPGEEVVLVESNKPEHLYVITKLHKDGTYEIKTALRGWPVPVACWGFQARERDLRLATKAEKIAKVRLLENEFDEVAESKALLTRQGQMFNEQTQQIRDFEYKAERSLNLLVEKVKDANAYHAVEEVQAFNYAISILCDVFKLPIPDLVEEK